MIRFLVRNMAGEMAGRYGLGELIEERENVFLLIANQQEGEEGIQHRQHVLREIGRTLKISVEIYEALRYIQEHLVEKPTLSQVASKISLSPNYLSYLFNAASF